MLHRSDTRCTAVGERYTRGHPTPPEPECEGVMTNCVGTCTEDDIYYATEANRLAELVQTVVAGFDSLSIPVDDAPLVLTKSTGRHAWWYAFVGLGAEERCGRDCALLSGYDANATLCEAGLQDVDVVVAIRAPHVIDEVAAAASACHHDAATGRPNVVVISWHQPLSDLLHDTLAGLVERYRGLVTHELLHGLGFLLSEFRKADVVERRTLTDLDGAVDDQVWSFKRGTLAHTAALQHVGCDDPTVPLPLMREPEMGRDQHFSTRVFRDDVMSYGVQKSLSALTLSAMADLPYYVVNFNHSECLRWGRGQGWARPPIVLTRRTVADDASCPEHRCAFLTTRCGAMTHDHSVPVSGPDECRGLDAWRVYADDLLEAKCAFGDNPCSSDAYDALTQMCDAMCASNEGAEHDCVVPNATLGYHERRSDDDDVYMVLLWSQVGLGVALVWFLAISAMLRWDVHDYETV